MMKFNPMQNLLGKFQTACIPIKILDSAHKDLPNSGKCDHNINVNEIY